jgi:hypothetical protein
MLSPDFSPIRTGKAASIRSFDSGYASGMVEDDELERDLSVCVGCSTAVSLTRTLTVPERRTQRCIYQRPTHIFKSAYRSRNH